MVADPREDRRLFRPRLLDAPPGLGYALERIAVGDAHGLVVPGLRRLTHSAATLGPIVAWLMRREARLIAVAQGLDTAECAGQVAARLIIEVSRWEREGLWKPASEGQSPSPRAGAPERRDEEADLFSRTGGESS
jgi:DNA invertase Pin-like site-specific DNA recombinase